MNKFCNKFKKTHFWPIFVPLFPYLELKYFFQKTRLCQTQHHMDPYHHAECEKKLMSQSLENFQTKGRKDGQKDG